MLRILVIDDDDTVRKVLRRVINKLGFEVDVAHSSVDARAMMSVDTYDIVFCDIRLPGDIPGQEILKSIRQRHPKTKVVMMSCSIDSDTRASLMTLGASDCPQKPFFGDRCLEVIENLRPTINRAA